MPIKLSINVMKIPRDKIVPGKNGKYVGLVLFENRDGPDQYGNNGFVSIDVTKEEREAKVRGVIIGNWKHLGQKPKPPAAPPARKSASVADPDLDPDEDVPF